MRWIITFENVLGFKSIGAVGAEVSGMILKDVTTLLQEMALLEPLDVGINYCFTYARECNVILTIVASGYTAEKCA